MEPAATPAVVASRLSAGKGRANTFDQLSFEIAPSSLTALVGANGSGKTTLFEVLLGLIGLRSGTLEVLGGAPDAARTRISYVSQTHQRVHDGGFTGREFVAAAYRGECWGINRDRRTASRAIERAVAQVGAQQLAGLRLAHMSGGQRQRLLIAQALVNEPQLMLMDEPLAQLDPAAQDQIVALVARLRDKLGIAVLVSTHDVNPFVRVADRVLYLANGRGRIGTVDEVVNDEVLSALYGVPMRVLRDRAGTVVMRDHAVVPTADRPDITQPRQAAA